MATVREALGLLKSFAPEEYEYKKEYDNIGLIVGDYEEEVKKIICCLDCTTEVIEEAIAIGANLIISHHPMIFYPVKNVTSGDLTGRKILKAAQNGINIYAAHTNLDFTKDGINDYIAALLGLRNIEFLEPYISQQIGYGRVGELSNKVFVSALKTEVETLLKDNHVRIIGDKDAKVKRIAVINGGGGGEMSYIDMALKSKADCLITADVRHHVSIYAKETGLILIEPQHYNMEHIYIQRLVQILRIEAKSKKLNMEILQSAVERNPRI